MNDFDLRSLFQMSEVERIVMTRQVAEDERQFQRDADRAFVLALHRFYPQENAQ